ncbi:MAG: T9SS type A sorting domain-containing protein, partial [Saprospiraceae bacterium]|nr:T9SS type A sorting domain-containing protein [Saprospiraceae bacterium]
EDACSGLFWSNDFVAAPTVCGDSGQVVVTFYIADACGNMASTSALIALVDTISPVLITQAQNLSIACEDADRDAMIASWLQDHAGASAVDACGPLTWSDDFPGISDTCQNEVVAIRFEATDVCGNAVTSTATLELQMTTAVTNAGKKVAMGIFPNPASDLIHVSVPGSAARAGLLQIVSATGNVVWAGKVQESPCIVPVGELPRGVYFLRFAAPRGLLVSRVVLR